MAAKKQVGIVRRLTAYCADHTFQAVVNAIAVVYVGATAPLVLGWVSSKVAVNPVVSQLAGERKNESGDESAPHTDREPIVIADTSGDFGPSVSYLPPEDRLDEARLSGSWRLSGGTSYVWHPDVHRKLEIRVPGGKWRNNLDHEWHYETTADAP